MPLIKCISLCLISFVTLIHAEGQVNNRKPNIIFILADDIGRGVLTVNGGQSYSTPRLDSMANHGMNFTHCESTPLCSPSRTMFLTGKQNYRNYNNWGYLSDTAKTVANLMHDAGYVTGIFGKHQLPCTNALMRGWGWDVYTIFEASNDSVYQNQNRHSRYKSPTLIDNYGLMPEALIKDKYCDDVLTDRIKNFIDSNKSRPFFIYYPMSIGHAPFCPTPDDAEYAAWDPYAGKSDKKFFPSMVHYIDKKVGEILDKLKSTGLDQNTVVFFCGDNGTPVEISYMVNGEKVYGQKGKTLEGGTNVPLIAYSGKYKVPSVITKDNLIDFADFFPTFADIAQYKNLGKYGVLDGLSFYKTLLSQPDTVKDYLFSHYDASPGADTARRWARDLVYKLYDSTTGAIKSGKFYNIVKDPQEKTPLANNALTTEEKAIKTKFLNVFKNFPKLPVPPAISNATVNDVTDKYATLSAAVINSGQTSLIERGTTISSTESPIYVQAHIADSIVALGAFSQKRKGLKPQTTYMFSVYAMNKNPSYSTGYSFGSFTTLSSPPLRQSDSFKVIEKNCMTVINWSPATFPSYGANEAGYVIFCSKDNLSLDFLINGQAPQSIVPKEVLMVNIKNTLPGKPLTQANFTNLLAATYYCAIVPFTFDGKNSSTYNYLKKGAMQFSFKHSCSIDPIALNTK